MNVSSLRPRQTYSLQEEPPNFRGLLFSQEPDGEVTILAYSGETDPDDAPDIPDNATIDNHVYISVDGIGQDWNRHREQIRSWYHGESDYGVNLQGTVIGIHEGEGKNSLVDGWRIVKNTVYLKALQGGLSDRQKLRERIYSNDPSVKTIHDQLAQSLRVGREVTFMAHSGGASQVALALALYGQDQEARSQIADHVRILGTAPAASFQDFEKSGVKSESILLTGSEKDPVFQIFRRDWKITRPHTVAPVLGRALWSGLRFLKDRGPYHQGEYIFEHNKEQGKHRLADFLSGGPGGVYELP